MFYLFILYAGLTPQAFAEDVYVKIVACCPEDTTEQIHARMEALHDEINRVADNPLLQSRCDEVTAAVARLEAELKQSTAEHENAEESLNNRSLRWLSQVEKVRIHSSILTLTSLVLFFYIFHTC